MIPKIIHLCWLSNENYPTKIKQCIKSWEKYLPEYKIMLWDTKRFNLEESIWVKQAFEKRSMPLQQTIFDFMLYIITEAYTWIRMWKY